MTWIIQEFDYDGNKLAPTDADYLERTEVFVLVNDKGAAAFVFKRPHNKREYFVYGNDLKRFEFTEKKLLEAVRYRGRKTAGLYELPHKVAYALIDYAKEINALLSRSPERERA